MEDKIQEQIKNEVELEMQKFQQENNLPETKETLDFLKIKKNEALKSGEAQQIGNRIATEDVRADFANAAAKVTEKNVNAAELNLKNKKRKRQIDREEAESQLEHEYKMKEIKRNGEHKQMLDKRRKLVEKYGYLYSQEHITKAVDGDGNEYVVPKDFSYSNAVNKFRQFGRNISKLDRPFLQTIKWIAILGGIVLGVLILKWTGVI